MKWDESRHPRVPAGNSNGGEFASNGGELSIRGYSSTESDVSKITKIISSVNSSTVSNKEWSLYYSKLAALKTKYGDEYMNDGVIPPIKIDNKIFLSRGTFENPKVYTIIEVDESILYKEDDDAD